MRVTAVVAGLAALAVAHAQQAPPRDAVRTPTFGTASVSGVVMDDQERPQPVRRAIVTLAGEGLRPSRGAITDDEGRFRIGDLPAGDFGLTVTRPGFITSMFGAKRPGRPGTPVLVAAGAHVDGVVVRLWRGAVVSGVVRDLDRKPRPNVVVRAIPAKGPNRTLLSLTNNDVATNSKGEYRIFGLEPGTYFISARPPISPMPLISLHDAEVDAIFEAVRRRSEPRAPEVRPPADLAAFGYAPVYYPGAVSVGQAVPVVLVPGQEAGGMDISLGLVRSGAVTGAVARADGVPVTSGRVQLTELTEAPDPSMTRVLEATIAPDGSFRITAVVPGTYRVVARVAAQPEPPSPIAGGVGSPVPLSPQLWADATITVAGTDLAGVNLIAAPGPTISGKVVFDSATLKPPSGRLSIFFAPASTRKLTEGSVISELGFVAPATAGPDGLFALASVPPGRFRLLVNGPAVDKSPWWPLSAMMGNRDLLDGDFDVSGSNPASLVITFTDRRSRIEGTLQTASGQPASDVFVIAFPADTNQWGPYSRRIKAVRPGVGGAFALSDLPPGEYLLAAVTDIDEDDWLVPGFLTQLVPGAVRSLSNSAKRPGRICGSPGDVPAG